MEIKTQVIEVKMNGGARGLQGIPGPKGETGATGPKGETGQAGVGIETIASGIVIQDDDYTVTPITFKKTDGQEIIINVKTKNGEKGETGATFTPVPNEQGVLSWTNDKGLPNPTSVNIKGEKGETGSPYLIYIEPFGSTSIPNLNDTFHCTKNNFSREPIIDDVFLLLWVSSLGDYPAYLVMSKVTGFEDNMALCTILNFYQVGAENGADGVSITDILSGNPTVQDEYTITPIEIKKSDNTSLTMNVKTKNGSNGATFIPALNEQGILSWTNDKNLPNPESISVKGDAGLPYLIYSEPMGSTNIPRFDQYVSCNLGKFNRTPKVGDIFYMLWVPAYRDLFPDYIVTAKIVNVSDTSAGCNVLYFSKIGGTGITDVSAGTPTQDDDYTITPITFNKSDNSNVTVNVNAKNGVGVPNGGTTGQVLAKASDTNQDVEWVNQTGGSPDYDSAPVGSIFAYPSTTPPTGYMVCDGSEISRTEYSGLFSVIGTNYGDGDGSTTFNLPNIKGRSIFAYNSDDAFFNTLGKTGGSKTHTQTIDEMPSHSHILSRMGGWGTGTEHTGILNEMTNNEYEALGTDSVGGGEPMDIMNPYIVACYIIKVSGTAILNGNVVDSIIQDSVTNAPSINAVRGAIESMFPNVTDGTPSPTGRKIGGKDEYFVEKQITTPAVGDSFTTVFAFTQDVTVHEMSNMVFPNGFDDDQYPNKTPFEYLFRHGTGVIEKVISENSWWANRTGIIRMYFTYNE